MKCGRCGGRLFLDRIYTDDTSFETACLHCGDRKYIDRGSEFGKFLNMVEKKLTKNLDGLG